VASACTALQLTHGPRQRKIYADRTSQNRLDSSIIAAFPGLISLDTEPLMVIPFLTDPHREVAVSVLDKLIASAQATGFSGP
jgi:hypothetical protein